MAKNELFYHPYQCRTFLKKQMNEEMEAELTKTDSRPDNLAVSEYASVDEAVPIGIRIERKEK